MVGFSALDVVGLVYGALVGLGFYLYLLVPNDPSTPLIAILTARRRISSSACPGCSWRSGPPTWSSSD